MKSRERTMLYVLISGVALVAFAKLIYPSAIKPVFDYSAKTAKASKQRDKLNRERNTLKDRLSRKYQEFVRRTGDTKPSEVATNLQDALYALSIRSKLNAHETTIGRSKITEDRKTHIHTISITVTTRGKFEECVQFVRGFYELPFVARFDNLKITPTPSRSNSLHDECVLSCEVEALVLPFEKQFPQPDEDDVLDHLIKYSEDTNHYLALARKKPFTPYVVYVEPSPTPEPRIVRATPRPTPGPSGPPTDPEGRNLFLRGVLSYGGDGFDLQEVHLEDARQHTTQYVSLGEYLDGGELVLVHPLGAVVHKADDGRDFGYYVYALGETLDSATPLTDAGAYPEIQIAMIEYSQRQDVLGLLEPLETDSADVEGPELPLPEEASPTLSPLILDEDDSAQPMGPPAAIDDTERSSEASPDDSAGDRRAAPSISARERARQAWRKHPPSRPGQEVTPSTDGSHGGDRDSVGTEDEQPQPAKRGAVQPGGGHGTPRRPMMGNHRRSPRERVTPKRGATSRPAQRDKSDD